MAQSQPNASTPSSSDTSSWVKVDSNLDHIHVLAQQLVRHLGESGARKTCLDNHWSGVLSVIDRMH